MFEENELEQIRIKKIKAMLDAAAAAKNAQSQVVKQPMMLTDDTFSAAIAEHELLVVDFWAPWCGPCRMVGPIIEQLATEYAGKVAFGKMNVDENRMIPQSLGVMSIPTIVVFHRGQAVKTIVGAYPKTHIETAFKPYIGH